MTFHWTGVSLAEKQLEYSVGKTNMRWVHVSLVPTATQQEIVYLETAALSLHMEEES